MPKKTKSTPKKSKAKAKPKRIVRMMGLRQRKRLITDAMEALVSNVPEQDRLEVVEHICDIGIDLLGVVTGVDATNAIVCFPDDGITRLIQLISKTEIETQVPCEDIIEKLIQHLTAENPSAAMLN